MKTRWTDARLKSLFLRYNAKYWAGRLPDYKVRRKKMKSAMGLCTPKQEIFIDVDQHSSEAEVRSTMLHEMAHAADKSRSKVAHGYGFWAEIERLLEQCAPLVMSFGELPQQRSFGSTVPRRFRLSRAAVERMEKRREAELLKSLPPDTKVIELTKDDIIRDFQSACNLTWKSALWAVGIEHSLLDVEGNPRNAWCARVIARGKRAHQRSRAMELEQRRKGVELREMDTGGPGWRRIELSELPEVPTAEP